MEKICEVCGQSFVWEDIDIQLFANFGFEPFDVCSQCMHMQKLAFRNERVFYRRKCNATGEDILSLYHPDSPYTVYKADYFWSDKWDAKDYAMDFDFSRPFFEQLAELRKKVPVIAIHNAKAENSEYCNSTVGNKNCYLIIGGDYNEDCLFGVLCNKNRSCLDIDYLYDSELCYFSADGTKNYDCQYLFNSSNCSNCYLCEECNGCSECILSFNLKNKRFCIGNKQYSEEEYFQKKKELITGKWSDYQNLFREFLQKRGDRIVKYSHIFSSQDCSGDYIKNSKNCTKCFDVFDGEDCRDVIYGSDIKDSFLCDFMGLKSELIFNSISTLELYDGMFCMWTGFSSNMIYCNFCLNSSDLFGCVGMNHEQYCILNKQYSEVEYNEMVKRIVEHMKKTGEWGQFQSQEVSCFGYNETAAQIYFPLTKEEALRRGFKWRDEEEKSVVQQTYEIPDNIQDVGDEIVNEFLQCDNCGKNYKIVKQELKWYRQHQVPVPRWCVDCRMKQRRDLRNPRKLWTRKCMKCGVGIETTFGSERSEKVYCEKCYLKEVY